MNPWEGIIPSTPSLTVIEQLALTPRNSRGHFIKKPIPEYPNGKFCKSCRDRKPLTEFFKAKDSCDGHMHFCKVCSSDRIKTWKFEHRDTFRTRENKKARENYRAKNGLQTHEQRSAKATKANRARLEKYTPEQRSEWSRRAAETVRRKRDAAKLITERSDEQVTRKSGMPSTSSRWGGTGEVQADSAVA